MTRFNIHPFRLLFGIVASVAVISIALAHPALAGGYPTPIGPAKSFYWPLLLIIAIFLGAGVAQGVLDDRHIDGRTFFLGAVVILSSIMFGVMMSQGGFYRLTSRGHADEVKAYCHRQYERPYQVNKVAYTACMDGGIQFNHVKSVG